MLAMVALLRRELVAGQMVGFQPTRQSAEVGQSLTQHPDGAKQATNRPQIILKLCLVMWTMLSHFETMLSHMDVPLASASKTPSVSKECN
jgi:hypothetical protein